MKNPESETINYSLISERSERVERVDADTIAAPDGFRLHGYAYEVWHPRAEMWQQSWSNLPPLYDSMVRNITPVYSKIIE